MAITPEQRQNILTALETKVAAWTETETKARAAFVATVEPVRKAKQEVRAQLVKAFGDDVEAMNAIEAIMPKSKRGRKGQSQDEVLAGLLDTLDL